MGREAWLFPVLENQVPFCNLVGYFLFSIFRGGGFKSRISGTFWPLLAPEAGFRIFVLRKSNASKIIASVVFGLRWQFGE